jgi:hypothetical protein
MGVYPLTCVRVAQNFPTDPQVFASQLGDSLSGYFQSYQYFADVQSDIRDQLRSIVDPSPWFLETERMLQSIGPWISLHVRRGDYLNAGTREVHGILSIGYYAQALRTMRMLVPDQTKVVVFSDEVDSAEKFLKVLGVDMVFIQDPPRSKGIESINLMSLSAGSIIANSSFSWWGAWLGDRENRPVIAPRPWINDPTRHERDLLPPRWLTLGNERG